jgi:hypothetical protein
MKCSLNFCSNSLEEYGNYDEAGSKVCGMCKVTFDMIRKYDIDL